MHLLQDEERVILDQEGDAFFWPIDRQTHVSCMRDVMQAHNRFVQNSSGSTPTAIELLHGYLISVLASIFQAERLRPWVDSIRIPTYASLWRFVLLNEELDAEPLIVNLLKKGLTSNHIRRVLRVFKPSFLTNGLSPTRIKTKRFKSAIISTASGDFLTNRHASLLEERVYVCPLYEWFYPPTKGELGHINEIHVDEQRIDAYVNSVAVGVFSRYGVTPSLHSVEYIRDWLLTSSRYLNYYVSRLKGSPDLLPERLWIGTLGIPWNSILAYCVREFGGKVTVHDHAHGANVSMDSHTEFVEFQHSDYFVTYSDAIKFLQQSSVKRGNLSSTSPKIFSIKELGHSRSVIRARIKHKPRRADSDSPELLYVQPMFMSDVSSVKPVMTDVVSADWQVRLFKFLRHGKFKVVVKPHPESKINFSTKLFADFDVNISYEKFEDALQTADVVLFDYNFTTTFGNALKSFKDVIFIDFGYAEIPNAMQDKLDKRVNRVAGWFDERNRAQTNWSELRQALRSTKASVDRSYVLDVLGDGA